jgi:hypothetical protein
MIQAAKIIGTVLATTGLIGAGVGVGVVFGALILGVAPNASLIKLLNLVSPLSFKLVYSVIVRPLNRLGLFISRIIFWIFSSRFYYKRYHSNVCLSKSILLKIPFLPYLMFGKMVYTLTNNGYVLKHIRWSVYNSNKAYGKKK